MPRFKLLIEYDGMPFNGWQRQAGLPSVQGVIEEALLALTGETLTLRGAGRTDAGVHATGQVAHIDLQRDWSEAVLRDGLNAHIRPHPVTILQTWAVDDRFDSRFSAKARHYLYRLIDRRTPLALERQRAWHRRDRLDIDAMNEAAKRLIGHHDFTTFRAANCQSKSPVKTLDRLEATRNGDVVEVRASARSFLHNQVRSMVGSLERVGVGKWTPDDVQAALEAADRQRCAAVAPPWGLYLTQVDY